MVGPAIQDTLFSLLTRFRSHTYVLTADIEKMYRQILVHPQHRKYQTILWREDSQQPIKTFELNTVTYGTSSVSFLATRSLHKLANDEALFYPKAAQVLKNDFYVDDMLTGAATRDQAISIRDKLIEVPRKVGLNLRKWTSNNYDLINSLSERSEESFLLLNLDKTIKTLGINWDMKYDSLIYTFIQTDNDKKLTKRNILLQTAQLFDPLGLLEPIISYAKILMQGVWNLGLDCDSALPIEIEWRHVRSESNPADLVSRGLMPNEFATTNIWQSGPSWLNNNEPQSDLEIVVIAERHNILSYTTTIKGKVTSTEFIN